jgi:hypothetical protein
VPREAAGVKRRKPRRAEYGELLRSRRSVVDVLKSLGYFDQIHLFRIVAPIAGGRLHDGERRHRGRVGAQDACGR